MYDADISKVNKIHKYLRKYLHWIQNSVFEGELGEADYIKIKRDIGKMIDKNYDSVLIFRLRDKYSFEKEVIGKERNEISNVI